MANYNPFDRKDDQTKEDRNWFMKTAIKVAAGTGTAFGIYGLWKMRGPAKKILEAAIEKDMKRKIATEQSINMEKTVSDIAENWSKDQKDLRNETWGEGKNPFLADPSESWGKVETPSYTRTNITNLETEIIEDLELEASYRTPGAEIKKLKPGEHVSGSDWIALNRKKTRILKKSVALAGSEATQFARLRQEAIAEYLETYMTTGVEREVAERLEEMTQLSDFFSSTEYVDTDKITDGFGKKAVDRITTIHDAYMEDKQYADIYQRKIKRLHKRFRLYSHGTRRAKLDDAERVQLGGGGYRQQLYGNIIGGAMNPDDFARPMTEETLFDELNNVAWKGTLTSKGTAPLGRFSKLQDVEYTGKIFNLEKALRNAESEGNLASHSISLVDYGSATRPDKRLVISLVPKSTDPNITRRSYQIEVPIGIDGRLPGGTPGLQQYSERWHIVGNVYGYSDDMLKVINTTEMNLMDVEKAINGSLFTGWDSFKDKPDKFVRQVNRMVRQNIQQNSAANGSIYDLYNAMSVDIPGLRDLTESRRPKYASARRTAESFVASSRALKKIIQARHTGKGAVVINLDLETLDNTAASPGAAILSMNSQVTKYGILVQDMQTGLVKETFEESNWSGYHHLMTKDRKQTGSGFNTRVRKWLRDSVLPAGTPAGYEVEAYEALLREEGAKDVKDRKQVIKEITDRVRALKAQYEKEGKEVYIATKNGSMFDLRAINMDDDLFAKQFEGKFIDVQALEAFRNNALGENNALNIERVIQRLTGKIGDPGVDYSIKSKQGIHNLMHLLKKRGMSIKGRETGLLNWTDPFWEFRGKAGVMTAHASPRVDAAFVAALLMKNVAEYTAGNYIDSSDYIAKLLKMTSGPWRPEDLTELFRLINDKTIEGFGVASFRSASQGMVSNFIANFIEPSEMAAFADPLNTGIRRRHAMPFNLRLKKTFIDKFGGPSAAGSLYKKHMGEFLTTTSVEDANNAVLNYVRRVEDTQNYFANSVLANTLYTLDMEKEPTVAISEGLAKKYEQVKIVNLQTDALAGDPVVNAKIHKFGKQVKQKAKEIAAELGKSAEDPMVVQKAEIAVASDPLENWGIDLSSEILSSGKYGGEVKVRKKNLYGKITSVLMEPNRTAVGKTSPSRLLIKIEETVSDWSIFFGSQVELPGTHGLIGGINTVSEAVASRMLGIGSEFIMANSPDFLKKGHVGAAKDVLISGLMKKLYNDYEATADPTTKRRIKRLISKISNELDATPDIENNRVIFNKKDIAYSRDLRTRVLGSTDLRLKQIVSWYKQAGLVWNKEEIADLHKSGFNFAAQFKPYLDHFKKITRLSDEQLRATYEGWDGLTKEGLRAAREDLLAFEQMMHDNVHNTEGSAKIFRVVPQIDQGFTLGILGYGPMALYRQDTTGLTNKDVIMRQDYFFGLRHTYHGQDKTTMDFVARHTFASRYDTYKSVRRTYTRFIDQLFAAKLTKAPLDINQISYIVDVKQRIALKSQEAKVAGRTTWSNMSGGELAAALADRNALEEKADELTGAAKERLLKEKDEIADALGAKEGGARILENARGRKRFYTTKDVEKLGRMAEENNGVLAFRLPISNNALEVDLDETIRRFQGQLPGKPKWSQRQINDAGTELKYILKQRLANATKDSPLRFNEKGNLEIGALVMDWDPMAVNQFTRNRSLGSWQADAPTETKMRLLRALHEWQTTIQKSKNRQDTDVIAAQDHFVRAWTEYMITGTDANKDSKFWKSGQFAPPSVKSYAADLTQMQKAVIQLEESRPGAFKKYSRQFQLLKDARLDTVVISESGFRKFQFVNQEGEKINAARYIEEHYKAQNSTMGKEIAEGRRYLPGGLVERFPIPQAGNYGMNSVNYLVMPNNALKMIGADPNAIYANPVHWGTQGGDFDGDIMFLHLKEIGMYNLTYKDLREANDRNFQNMLENKDMQSKLVTNQITLDSKGNVTRPVKIGDVNTILYRKGEMALVQNYDTKGSVNRMWVKSDMLDLTDRVTHVTNLIGNLAGTSSKFATQARVAQYAEAQVNTLISKELIPITTNLLKKRVKQILGDANLRKDPLRLQSFTGNVLHGLAGMGQAVIDLAKHTEEGAKLAKITSFLSTGRATTESKELWMELEQKAFGSLYDEKVAAANHDILAGRLEAIEILGEQSKNFKMQNKIEDMMYMGKQGTTLFHAMQSWADTYFDDLIAPTRQKSVMEQLNDSFSRKLGTQIDLGPIMRKTGKYGAIGASIFLGLSLFTPFGNSKSLNPLDMFVDIGNIDGQASSISSPLELSRKQPLDMVNASFSREAFIRLNKDNTNKKKASIINALMTGTILARVDAPYEFVTTNKGTYSNYTKSINMIGTKELKRRYE